MSFKFLYIDSDTNKLKRKFLATSDIQALDTILSFKANTGHNHNDNEILIGDTESPYYGLTLRVGLSGILTDLVSKADSVHSHTSNEILIVDLEEYENMLLTEAFSLLSGHVSDFRPHISDTDIHVTPTNKSSWDNKADANHTQDISTINGLQTELDNKSPNTHNHTLASLTEKSYNSLTDKPNLTVYATTTALNTHINNEDTHITTEEKEAITELITNPVTINNFITNVHDVRNILDQTLQKFDVFFNRNLTDIVINNMPSFYYRIRVRGSIHARGGANSANYDFEANPLYIHIFDRDTNTIIKTYTYNYSRADHLILFDNYYYHLDTVNYLNLGIMLSDKSDLSGTEFSVIASETDFEVDILIDRIAKRAYHKEFEITPNTVTLSSGEHIITLPDGADLLFCGWYHLDAYFETEEMHSGSPSYTAIPLSLQCREYGTSTWLPLDKSVFSGLSNGVYVRSLQGSRILNLASSKKLQIRLYCPNDTELKYSGYVHLHYLTDYDSNEVM